MGTPLEGTITLSPPQFDRGIIFGDTAQPKQNVYEQSATQNYAVGTKLVYADREFHYAKNGADALTIGRMNVGSVMVTDVENLAQATSGADQEIGDVQILMDVATGGTWVENEYAEGYLLINDATGEGEIYRVLANKIRSTDTLMDVLLETPLRTAWAIGTEVTMIKNKWYGVVVSPTTASGAFAGVNLVAVTAAYYCWLQTKGYAPVYVDDGDTLIIGNVAGLGGTDAGACDEVAADTTAVFGTTVSIAAADEAAIIDLGTG